MSTIGGPNIVDSGLILELDAGNTKSYPGTGTTWFDKSGYANNGTLTNGPTFNTGSLGNIVLDGVDDYVPTATLSNQLATTGFTISMFFYYVPTTTNDNLISWGLNAFNTSNTYSWEIRFRNNGGYIEYAPGRTVSGTGAPTRLQYFPPSAFGNRIMCLDITSVANGVTTMYENAISRASFDYVGIGTSTVTNPLWIGRGTDAYISGNFYSVKLYNRALSASEVLQNYNATRTRFGL
jgi:hypothetical protein